jgi:protein-disulfide isomerase
MNLLKYTASTLLLGVTLFATTNVDNKVIAFEKQRFLTNQGLVLQKVSVRVKEELPLKGWYGYVLNITANVPGRGVVSGSDMLFSNGKAVATDLLNVENATSYKEFLTPRVTAAHYKKSHLIAGNENAKNKVVVFSDPLCPACMQTIPGMIQKVNSNSQDIALYYYHFPLLSLHPAALTLSKAMVVAKQNGIKDIEMKVYTTNFGQHFNSRETNAQKILDGFNKIFKTNITLAQVDNVMVNKEVEVDMKAGEELMINGTPTIYVNGTNDKSRRLFGALGK